MFGSSRRQSQKAGPESLQLQAARDVVIGISEKRAREIAKETSRDVIASYTDEAFAVIQDRIFKLDDRVIASLVRAGRIEAFADPGFQRTYKKAQNGAASTERNSDYDMLAALLADRADRGTERTIRAGIERSIEIVDQVDDEALRALTVFQALQQYSPNSGLADEGLDAMERLFEQLLDGPLPTGQEWMEHLDILDALRINTISKLRKFDDYYISKMIGYVAPGQDAATAAATIAGTEPPVAWSGLLIPHDLKPGFVRVAAPTLDRLEARLLIAGHEVQALAIASARSDFGFGSEDPDCKLELMKRLKQRNSLRIASDWWDDIPQAAHVTAVGRVLARANAERLDQDKLLPPLD